MSEFISLAETAKFIVDNRGKTVPTSDHGIPLIKTNCISNDNLYPLIDGMHFITKETYDNWFRSHPEPDDIIITLKGSQNGAVCLVPDPVQFAIAQDMVAIRVDEKKINKYYLLAALRSREVQHAIKTLDVSGVIPHLKKSDFDKLLIRNIDRRNQDHIGELYYQLSKKISLLRQQNETLEELAQTLFKRWFVDFEFPDENGQPYKSSGGKMIESELGEIPEGWEAGEVSDFVRHSTKSISPNSDPTKVFSHYSIPAFDNGRYPTKDRGESILSNKYVVSENSILVSKLNPSTSRIWTVFTPSINPICSTEIQVFIPNKNSYAFSFGLFHFSGVKREMAQRASGTSSSHQRVRPSDILDIEFVVPTEQILIKFEASVLAALKSTEENQEEIQTLSQIRDALLPKLMSGELTIN